MGIVLYNHSPILGFVWIPPFTRSNGLANAKCWRLKCCLLDVKHLRRPGLSAVSFIYQTGKIGPAHQASCISLLMLLGVWGEVALEVVGNFWRRKYGWT